MKIAVLSTHTIQGIEFIGPEWYISEYSRIYEDISQAESKLTAFNPDVILLSLDTRQSEPLDTILSSLCNHSNAVILVHTDIEPIPSPLRHLHGRRRLHECNLHIYDVVSRYPQAHVLDLDWLVSCYGNKLFDSRFYFLSNMRFGAFGLEQVSKQLKEAIDILFGQRKKVLVLDLDNTLWGGLLSDGITLSDEGPGKAYHDFQKSIKALSQSGVLLAICSKNDESQALDTIKKNPYMVLRTDDFATWRINWNYKSQNLREIAAELNLNTDSFVFLDDSLFERELIRELSPEISVPDLPEDPSEYASFLAELPYFETFQLTDEDKKRTKMYVQERERNVLSSNFDSYEDFLKGLEIKVVIEHPTEHTLSRIEQLTQRTNQFNVTLRKYSLEELHDLNVYQISYRDRIGEQGIVGAILIENSEIAPVLAGFYMSCRILGRGAEEALLETAATDLDLPLYIPLKTSSKNHAAQNFFLNRYSLQPANEGRMRLDKEDLKGIPDWIHVEHPDQ